MSDGKSDAASALQPSSTPSSPGQEAAEPNPPSDKSASSSPIALLQSSTAIEDTATGRRVLINTGSLAGSSLWRIFISFVLQILITRVLGVESFGQYVSALAFLNLAQVVSELGLNTLLVRDLAAAPTHRHAYFRVALRVQLAAAFATWAGLILLASVLPISIETRNALWLVGASLPFFAVTSVCQTLFKAAERMELVLGVEGAINALILLISVVVLYAGGGIAALMGIMVVTQALSALISYRLLGRARLLATPQEAVPIVIRDLWGRTRPFYWLALTDVLLHRIDILLLNLVTTDYVIGVYGIAYSVVRVLIKLIQSYWLALYPTLSRLWHQSARQYAMLSSISLRYGLMLVLMAAAVGTGLASDLLVLLYNDNAADSTNVFRLLVWTAPLFVVELYAITQLLVKRQTRLSLWITWLHIGAVVILLPVATIQFGAVGTAAAMVVATSVGTLAAILIAQRQEIPLTIPRMWALLAATALTAGTALWLPTMWVLRGAIATASFIVVISATGLISPADRSTLRNVVKSSDSRR